MGWIDGGITMARNGAQVCMYGVKKTELVSKLHGVETYWHDNGAKEIETYYLCGEESGRIKWDEKGNVTKTYFSSLEQPSSPKERANSSRKKSKSKQ